MLSVDLFICTEEPHDLDLERVDENLMIATCRKCSYYGIITRKYMEDINNGSHQ